MRVLLINHWHDDNKGDTAITQSTISLIRGVIPDANFTVRTMHGGEDHLIQERATRLLRAAEPGVVIGPSLLPGYDQSGGRARRAWHALRWLLAMSTHVATRALFNCARASMRTELRHYDVVVAIGGSDLFATRNQMLLGWLRLFSLLEPIRAAQDIGLRTLFLGHTLGPFETRASRRLSSRVLLRASAVLVRDQASLDLVLRMGAQATLAPDMAFAMVPWSSRDESTSEITSREAVLVVRQHPYLGSSANNRLLGELRHLACELLNGDVVDRIVVVSQVIGPTAVEDDRGLSRKLAGSIGQRAVLIEDDLTPQELQTLYGRATITVTVRLHAAILALAAGAPAFAIAYHTTKTAGVMDECGFPTGHSSFTEFDAERVMAFLPTAAARRPFLRAESRRRAVTLQHLVHTALQASGPGQG